jgi:Putative peptidoglycan binding domain
MLMSITRRLIAGLRNLVTLIFSLGMIWSSYPIDAQAQPVPTPVLLQQLNEQSAPQPLTEADRAQLNDPLFQLVLKDHADATTLTALKQFLKPARQEVFVVDEHIVDPAPKVGDRLAARRSIVTMSGTTNKLTLDQNILFSMMFSSEQFQAPNFIEAMGWDDTRSQFNYYKLDQAPNETTPSWKFRGNSRNADTLSTAARQGTCMQCHINGATVMKELLLPWNNWDSFSAKTPYLSKGNASWPIVNAANSPLNQLAGAESFESGTMFSTLSRFNERRIQALMPNGSAIVADARRLLKPIFITTEFNLLSSDTLSTLHPLAKPTAGSGDAVNVPTSFFLNNRLLGDLGISANFFEFTKLSSKDYEHLVRQTKTSLNGKQPGDTNFAWFGPEPSFIDNDFVSQLLSQNIVPPAFVAAALAVDLETPMLSPDRAKLWSDKILPAQFTTGAKNDLIPQVVANLTALNPASGTPEAKFLQILRQPDTAVANLKTQVDQYASRERNRLARTVKPEIRSQEWIRLYKLELQRRETLLQDVSLKSLDETGGRLLLARGDVNAKVSPLPSTIVQPRPLVQLSDQGEDVRFLQQLLKQFGVFNGVIDGDFGPQTEAAVILAQKQLKLTADGVVGAQTWAALQTAVA